MERRHLGLASRSIDEQYVIPIVGPDLLHVEIHGTTTLLDQYIAGQLALNHKLPIDSVLPQESDLITWFASFSAVETATPSATRYSRS